MIRSTVALILMGGVGLVGCAGGEVAGEEGAGKPALVMLDGEARAAGFSLVTHEGKVAPVTPIELEEGAVLVGPGQRIPLSGAPGELLVVTGKHGTLVGRTLATEVDADAVRVDGNEKSVRALASLLGARVTGAGPWELRARGIVTALSHQGPVEGVTSMEILDVKATTAAVMAAAAAATDARPYSSADPRFASFGLLGARSPVCEDPSLGTWVSIPQHFEHWHAFTLHVERGAHPGELAGTVDAHVWAGGAGEEPPDSCSWSELDVRVTMAATGTRAADGGFRFDGGSWSFDRSSCSTGVHSGFGYLPDHFVGGMEGGALRTVNQDGSRFDNAPVGFSRISCE